MAVVGGPAAAGPRWRLHSTLARSEANGPGVRFVVWSQGCGLACAGCFNPDTHAPEGADVRRVADVVGEVLATDGIEGVTLTGGEPLEQPEATGAFCAAIRRRTDLGIIVLTGFTRAEVEGDARRAAAVADADLVIAGRYNERLRLGSGLRGSSNKEYWALTGRYTAADLAGVPEAEFVIGADGSVTLTGMHRWEGGPR
ncbi:4Fe-4S single cluster domain-containing protein [Streptomyces phyllanthi]|uniref:Radical SAM protein n=1 Tax=Streptomyces phyllanthi TaxID=1803180 RepID=A0A5N8WEZ9_9ACTN|nr:4Fe-4S single cluster domain-containing protein [Streptomyces phyllanthi]MPY44755.1 radical SAM protein [Streptomyces phyllanthi]